MKNKLISKKSLIIITAVFFILIKICLTLSGWENFIAPQVKASSVSTNGIIMEHGKYSDVYLRDWSALPTGKELIQNNLAKNIKSALGLGAGDPFDLKTGAGFQSVIGEQKQMTKIWKKGNSKEIQIKNLAYKVSWNSAGDGNNILFYIEGYDRVVIENLAIIQTDSDYRLKNTIRIVGCGEVIIKNVYVAGTVSQHHIGIYGCKYATIENVEVAGVDYFGKGTYRNGGGISVANGEYVATNNPKLLKWLTIQNCYIHDLDDGDYQHGDPNWRNQDGILLESPMDGILFNCYFENWKLKYGDAAIDAGHRGYRYPEGSAYSPDPNDPVHHFFRIERNIIDNCSHAKSPGYDSGNTLFWANNLFINSSFTDYHYGFQEYFAHNTYIFNSDYEFDYFLSLESIAKLTSNLAYFHNCLFYLAPSNVTRKFNSFISQHWRDTFSNRWKEYHADNNIYRIGMLPDYWVKKNNDPGNNIDLSEWKGVGNDLNSFIDIWETLGGNLLVNTARGNSGEFIDWAGDNPLGWNVNNEIADNKITESPLGKCRLISSNGNYISINQTVLNNEKLYKYGIGINNIYSGGLEIMEDGPIYYYKGNYTGYIKTKSADKDIFVIKRAGKADVVFDDAWIKEVTTKLPQENYFVNYNAKNFRLLNSSPATDAGSVNYLNPKDYRMKISQDFYGAKRDGKPSIGAFENEIINQPPFVNAGSDQAIALPSQANLSGRISDDGFPNPPGRLIILWSKISGPGLVSFSVSSSASAKAIFSSAGVYVLRLNAADGKLSSSDEITITVSGKQKNKLK